MSTDDDDILSASVPDADAEPTAAELAHARTFAELVDKTLSGRTPAAMSADDRALLEVATVIRVTRGALELAPQRSRSIVEDALRQAVGAHPAAASMGGATPITSARRRRWVPWAITATSTVIAAAAIMLMWLRTPKQVAPVAPIAQHQELPVNWMSRPVELPGPIAREQSGDAISRIDYIFADRLDGFRERRLRGGKP
ncbi:MAG: hypothetical protein WKG01_06785 [Kofleriaceae bacterium]